MTTNKTESTKIATASIFGKTTGVRRFKTLDPLPVLGHVMRIRSMTDREKSDWEAETLSKKGTGLRRDKLKDSHLRLIQICVVDADGQPYITNSHLKEMRDYWDSADTGFLYDEIATHCRINKDDNDELVKNSESVTVGD